MNKFLITLASIVFIFNLQNVIADNNNLPPNLPNEIYSTALFDANNTLFVGTEPLFNNANGLYSTKDNGATWSQISRFAGKYPSAFYAASDALYMTTDLDGIYKSTDKGQSWIKLAATGLPADSFFATVTVYNNILFVVINNKGLYRTTDAGQSF